MSGEAERSGHLLGPSGSTLPTTAGAQLSPGALGIPKEPDTASGSHQTLTAAGAALIPNPRGRQLFPGSFKHAGTQPVLRRLILVAAGLTRPGVLSHTISKGPERNTEEG